MTAYKRTDFRFRICIRSLEFKRAQAMRKNCGVLREHSWKPSRFSFFCEIGFSFRLNGSVLGLISIFMSFSMNSRTFYAGMAAAAVQWPYQNESMGEKSVHKRFVLWYYNIMIYWASWIC